MSTVRIYRVAELLGTTSQEVMALLKRDHGIEVKSASSTIEEVVARQFVDRLAKQRGVTLPPPAQMFLDTPAPTKGKKPAGKAPEPPPKPAAPTLGPPRLVKTITPRPAPEGEVPGVAAHPHLEPMAGTSVDSPAAYAGELPGDVETPEVEPEAPGTIGDELPASAAGHQHLEPMAGLAVAEPPARAGRRALRAGGRRRRAAGDARGARRDGSRWRGPG